MFSLLGRATKWRTGREESSKNRVLYLTGFRIECGMTKTVRGYEIIDSKL